MDAIQQLVSLGIKIDQHAFDSTRYPLPMRMHVLREIEKKIAMKTEVTEATYAFATKQYVTEYELPAFILKPKIVEFRRGQDIYVTNVKSNRFWANRSLVDASDIPFLYAEFERRIRFYYNTAPPPVTFLASAIAGNDTEIILNDITGFPTSGYGEIRETTLGIVEKFQWEGIDVALKKLLNVRRGACSTLPRVFSSGGGSVVTFLNIAVRYFRMPDTATIYNVGNVDVANNDKDVIAGTSPTLWEGKIKPGWNFYLTTPDAVSKTYRDNTRILPVEPRPIESIDNDDRIVLVSPYDAASATDQPYFIVTVSEYGPAFHDLAVTGAAAYLLKGSEPKRSLELQAEFEAGCVEMRHNQRLQTRDMSPEINDWTAFAGVNYGRTAYAG